MSNLENMTASIITEETEIAIILSISLTIIGHKSIHTSNTILIITNTHTNNYCGNTMT